MNRFISGAVVALSLGLAMGRTASAQIVALNNLPGTSPFTSGDPLGNIAGNAAASGFSAVQLTNTGATVSLLDVSATFTNFDNTNNRVVTGGIYSNVGGSPGAQLIAFNQQTILAGQADITKNFLPSSSFNLTGGASYWVVFTADVGTFNSALTWRRDTANTAPTPAAGFTTAGYKASTDNAGTWSADANNNLIRVRVNATPEPGSLAFLGLGLTVIPAVVRRRQRG